MTVRWERLRGGVFLAAVLAALAWATAWPAATEAVGQKQRRTRSGQRVRQALPPAEEASAPAGERRVALVVGNGRYRELGELPNAVNDARAMAGALRELGFEVVGPAEGYVDLTREGLVEALRRFEGRLAEVERAGGALVVGLLYYAGHGMEVDGVNYLLPVDIRRGGDARYEGLELQKALDGMARYGVSIVILDACRDNPLVGQVAVRYRSSGELKPMEVGGGKVLMMYGASPGERAAEGKAGGNGLYTEVLLKHLGTPGLTAEQVFARVGEEVEQRSKGRQRPWMSGNLYGRFRFRSGGTVDGLVSSPGNAGAVEREAWETAKQSNNPEVVREFLREYPNGVYAKAARVLLAALEKGQAGGGVGFGGTPASGGAGVSPGAQPPAGARAGQVWASPAGIRLVWDPAGRV
ncbi:MAG: caspase family protein [Acidobacteriota bacterium]|nr:caspase family protein [Acidobacteriota bacterium]